MAQKKKVSANRKLDKKTILARTNRAEVVGVNGPKSEIWKGNLVLQEMGQKLVAAGTALKAVQTDINALESQLTAARGIRATRVGDYDRCYDLYATGAEASSKTTEDLANLGLDPRTRSSHHLGAPLGLEATFDATESLIRAHVDRGSGTQACIIEISANPKDPDGWKRLPGVGAIQTLSGYAPGTYWLRAANASANELSRFTDPVAVTVR